jgi:DegV family protein with EDD domain
MMTSKNIKFVTDSVADLPPELIKKWGITVVPCFVNYGGASYADDGVELVREEYYGKLATMTEVPTTAAMPPDLAREHIEKAFEGADHLIIITTPAKLSAVHNSMRLGAQELPEDQYTLIDSGQVSIGMGWQVLIGAEVAAETGSVEQTLAAIQYVRRHQRVNAAIATMEFLRRSGRVGWAAANIGSLLQIKPLVEVRDGEVVPVARIRTFSRAIDKLAELAREQAPLDRLALLHINNPEGVEELRTRLADIVPPDTIIGNIGPTVGTHIGPGAVGIATVSKGWKDAFSAGNTG